MPDVTGSARRRAASGLVTLAALLGALPAMAAGGFWLPPDFDVNRPRVVVALGDSITRGTLGDPPRDLASQPYPAILQTLLQAEHAGVTVLNRGVGGEKTEDGLARVEGVLSVDRPAFLLVMEGTNDLGRIATTTIVANLREIVHIAKAHSTIPIVGAVLPHFGNAEFLNKVRDINDLLVVMASQEGVRFVDTFAAMNDPALFGDDGFHPTQEGYQVLGQAWLPAVSEAIDDAAVLLGGPHVASGVDHDGDGIADIAVYRGETGEWFVRRSSDGQTMAVPWGAPSLGDRPVPASYTLAGQVDVAVYRTLTGEWLIRRSFDGGLTLVNWGAPSLGDLPVPGDYDGDGVGDIAVYRRTTGEWFILRSGDGGVSYLLWGAPQADLPVPADYDGDGRVDVAVYRRSTGEWFVLRSSDLGVIYGLWGCPACGDVPVPNDYEGDGRADLAVYRSTTGEWLIRRSFDLGLSQLAWGAPALGDVPVPANYAFSAAPGPVAADLTVYRASTGEWFSRRALDGVPVYVPWGAPTLGDTPTGRPAAVR